MRANPVAAERGRCGAPGRVGLVADISDSTVWRWLHEDAIRLWQHRCRIFARDPQFQAKAGRCEAATGIAPFSRLVGQVMNQPPYNEARRVLWAMDNGASHRGEISLRRLTQAYPRLVPVHGPVHASWLNQIGNWFSILQRKALTPNDFPCLEAVAERLCGFERYYESIAIPFARKFTRSSCGDGQIASFDPSMSRSGAGLFPGHGGCVNRANARPDQVMAARVFPVDGRTLASATVGNCRLDRRLGKSAGVDLHAAWSGLLQAMHLQERHFMRLLAGWHARIAV